MEYFDYESIAREAGIPPVALRAIESAFRKDFPWDDMMYELHVLRACLTVREGLSALDDVLRDCAAAESRAGQAA